MVWLKTVFPAHSSLASSFEKQNNRVEQDYSAILAKTENLFQWPTWAFLIIRFPQYVFWHVFDSLCGPNTRINGRRALPLSDRPRSNRTTKDPWREPQVSFFPSFAVRILVQIHIWTYCKSTHPIKIFSFWHLRVFAICCPANYTHFKTAIYTL